MSDYYPSFIELETVFPDDVPPLTLARAYARALREAGLGEIVRYDVAGSETNDVSGTQADLDAEIARLGSTEAHYFVMVTKGETRLVFSRGRGGRPVWNVNGRHPSKTRPSMTWMDAMARLAIASAHIPGLQHQVLARHESSRAEFPPQPPFARINHLVTVTEVQVADAYEDPASFFQCWDRVERIGDLRVCIRALDKLDDEAWLAWTFESTMHLARLAKPKKTLYVNPTWHPDFAPWWEYGDIIADERAGYPALSFVGYAPVTRTVEYAGFCTDTDIAKGGPDPRHVLIREIHEIRALVKAKQDREGRPVDTVRIVFLEEWMARRERRPLLDVGARVFFMDPKTGRDVEVTD